MKAKERGAKIIHVDPRFTRTSAVADVYAPIRSGSDIVFLGALISWMLQNERYFKEYVLAFTNASYLVREDFQDTEDLDGLFSGWQQPDESGEATQDRGGQAMMGGDEHKAAPGTYDQETWQFETVEVPRFDGEGTASVPKRDETLQHPRCVINVLRRHFARYTPEMVEAVCGSPQASFRRLCELVMPRTTPAPLAALLIGLAVVSAAEIMPWFGWSVIALMWIAGLGAAALGFIRIDGPGLAFEHASFPGPPMNPRAR